MLPPSLHFFARPLALPSVEVEASLPAWILRQMAVSGRIHLMKASFQEVNKELVTSGRIHLMKASFQGVNKESARMTRPLDNNCSGTMTHNHYKLLKFDHNSSHRRTQLFAQAVHSIYSEGYPRNG